MNEDEALADLLRSFQVSALGAGDPVTGTNVLAAMACTLANLAPDDGSVVHPDRGPARLGTSLLVLGAGSCARIVDEVLAELARRQENLRAHLRRYCAGLESRRQQRGSSPPPRTVGDDRSEELITRTQQPEEDILTPRPELWRNALEYAPVEQARQLAERPKMLVSAAGPDDLPSQLTGLRPGRPLVHLGLTRPRHLSDFSEAGAALLEGRHTPRDGDGPIRANLLMTDPMEVLAQAAVEADSHTAWLGHFLWLSDASTGPDVPAGGGDDPTPEGPAIGARFRHALSRMIVRRLNLPLTERKLLVLPGELDGVMGRWTEFLRRMEKSLPGIPAAAGNLPAGLMLGLLEMSRAGTPLPLTADGVLAIARFLVRRMANARTTILHAAELARRRDLIRRIHGKLGNGGAEERKISKDLKIHAAERDECLRWMAEAGLAYRDDTKWHRREGRRLDFNSCGVPVLEI